jgi:hypothetical protein
MTPGSGLCAREIDRSVSICLLHFKLDAMQELKQRRDAARANEQLSKAISEVIEAIKCSSFAHILLHRHHRDSSDDIMSEHGNESLQRLFESGKTVEGAVNLVALLAVQIVIPSVFAASRLTTSRLNVCHNANHARLSASSIYLYQNSTARIGQRYNSWHGLQCPGHQKLCVSYYLRRRAYAHQTRILESVFVATPRLSRRVTACCSISLLPVVMVRGFHIWTR